MMLLIIMIHLVFVFFKILKAKQYVNLNNVTGKNTKKLIHSFNYQPLYIYIDTTKKSWLKCFGTKRLQLFT